MQWPRRRTTARPSSRSWGSTVEILKVSSKSNPNSVAGALAGVIRQSGAVEGQVVGAGALNQAIKAVAIARGYVAPSGIDLACVPTFADIEIDGQDRTAIRLLIETRTDSRTESHPDLRDGHMGGNGSASRNGHGHASHNGNGHHN